VQRFMRCLLIKQNMNFNFQPATKLYFCYAQKWSYLKVFIILRSMGKQNVIVPHWLVKFLHPPQKSAHPQFWNGLRYGIKKHGVESTLNGMNSMLKFIKIQQLVQKLRGRQTDRPHGDLTSKESMLKKNQTVSTDD
jgi:predicted aldo/keto reductase-like oxidoreductase